MKQPDPERGASLQIGTPGTADVAAVAGLHYRSWIATYAPLLGAGAADRLGLEERTAFWDRLIRTRPPRMGSLVAARAGHVVGLVQWETPIAADPRTGEIHAIHVAEDERGTGVGRTLLQAATAALREQGMRRAILWVLEGNAGARAFYERQGWEWDGTRVERPLGGFPGFPTVIEVRYALNLDGPQPRAPGC